MRERHRLVANVIVMVGAVAGCHGGGGGGAKFMTSIPGGTPLGGLTGAQGDQLCQDEARFLMMSSYEMDSCAVAGFIAAAFFTAFSSTATDAEVQSMCASAYDACLHPDGGAGSGFMCNSPPANCTATVAELGACLDDEAAQVHKLASAIPACGALTRASFATGGGTTPTTSTPPASCQAIQTKCSGGSGDPQAFGTDYCALIDPCCASAGLTSQCSGVLQGAAFGYDFNATAAATCLDALRALQAGPDFCGSLASVPGSWNNDSAVIPECAGVFKLRTVNAGAAAPGETCIFDSDCAPGPTGHAVCALSSYRSGAPSGFDSSCFEVSATPSGGPCVGSTYMSGTAGTIDPPADGVICDRAAGLVCDDTTHVCLTIPGAGAPCTSSVQCDGVANYCSFDTGACAPRLASGATCPSFVSGACVDGTYCKSTTSRCTPQAAVGAACTDGVECRAGFCNNGKCPSTISTCF